MRTDRRARIRHAWFWISVAALCGATVALSPGSSRGQAAAAERPNIVVVMTDDQTMAELRGMPATRRLVARRGVSFSRFYVSYPVCCPSRATYLTGQYANNHGVMGLYPPTGGYGALKKRNTLPVWLQRAGYRTVHIGKFLNGYGDQQPADVPPGWSDWHATVDYSTYRMWGYRMNDNGVFHTYGSPFKENPRLYQTNVLTSKALAAIRRGGPRPLFLSLSFLAPHYEDRRIQRRTGRILRAAPRDRDANPAAPPTRLRAAGVNERDMSDKPAFIRRLRRLTGEDIARLVRDARARQAALLAVDRGVARIVRALRRRGELDNTYIVFTSDNGYMQGQHRVRSGKMLPYEPSSRVPLLISGPGLPRGASSGELAANVDLAPTLVDIAGARAGLNMDGRSLLPFARRPGRRSNRPILHETGGSRYVNRRGQDEGTNLATSLRRVMTYRAVRTRSWLYVRYRDGARELYDMRRDPGQLQSRHADRRYQPTRRALHRLLRRLARCEGAQCRRAAPRIPGPRR